MIRMVTCVAFALTMLAAATTNALADSTQKSTRADGTYQTAQNWNDRVCCKRGAQDWWTTRRACNRSGGYQVSNRQCREDWNDRWDQRWWGWQGGDWSRRVCCKYGNRDWWSTARECRNSFGYITNDRACRTGADDVRVCCKRGRHDWLTTRQACERVGGYRVPNRECREDWNDRWDSRWWNWQGGDWSRRVCCKYGNRDWWTTARECRNSAGYVTNNRQCRNDRWN